MAGSEFGAFVSYLGLLMQAGGTVLLLLLFVLLRRQAQRRNYFLAWSNAWLCLTVALLTLGVGLGNSPDEHWWVFPTYFIYMVGKLCFFGLLLVGAIMYVRGYDRRLHWGMAYVAGFAYTVLAFMFDHYLDRLVVWQAPVAVVCCVVAGSLLLNLAPARRTLGSRATGIVFLLIGALWALYFVVFQGTEARTLDLALTLPAVLAAYNSYFDLLLQMLLAFGMILILLEDSKREIDAAHAELALAHDKLLTESYRDSLTGALNRRAFTEGIGLEAAASTFGTVVMLDLDNLKVINDELGHAAGDDMLKHLVAELRLNSRPTDMLYRMGGDEFLLVLPRSRAEAATPRLDLMLRQAPRLKVAGSEHGLRLKTSLGAADYTSPRDMQDAIKEADRLMYEAKRRHKATGELDTDPRGQPT